MRPTPEYFDEAYYLRGGVYENKMLEWRPRAEWLISRFKPLGRTLEIGSGEGCLLQCLKDLGADVYGIDLSRYGSYFYRRDRVLGSDVYLPFTDKAFSFVVGFDIMEHNLEEDISTLVAELGRVCSWRAFFNIALSDQTDDKVDPTHFTLKPRAWWEDQFGHSFDIIGTGDCPTLAFKDAQFTLRKREP